MTEVKKIVVLPGDGIGKEVCTQAVRLLEELQQPLKTKFEFEEHLIGGGALSAYGTPVKPETLEACKNSDAVLLGAVGAPEFDNNPSHLRPEKALLGLRAALQVYCNLRPAKLYDVLLHASSLKPEIVSGIDLLVVRELTGGIYFGEPANRNLEDGIRKARNTMVYDELEIRRIAVKAFEAARMRRKKVTSVDKANVLIVSQLWREVVEEVGKNYPDVKLEHMLVDNCAMQLVRNPKQFDVMLTTNMFGDILSDEASMLTGSLGMLPSASLGDGPALFEPVHGSAPDIAGQDKANPIAMINSVAMMIEYTLKNKKIAESIDKAVETVLQNGFHTGDLFLPDGELVGTRKMGELIIQETLKSLNN